jgi:DNA-binding transcriptional regulator YhcF (GntR family)
MALVRRHQPGRLPRPRLYQQLADHITDFIEAQGLAPGDRLPPERELAVELGVSRATLAQALVALEMQGKVAVRHGDGAVILDPAQRVAAVVAALVGYTQESLQAARLPVVAGLLAAAALAPEERRRRLVEQTMSDHSPEVSWAAIRDCVGENPLIDLDVAIERAGGELPAQVVDSIDAILAAIEAGDPAVVTYFTAPVLAP